MTCYDFTNMLIMFLAGSLFGTCLTGLVAFGVWGRRKGGNNG